MKKKEDYSQTRVTAAPVKEEKEEKKKEEKKIIVEAAGHSDKFSYGQSAGLRDDLDVDDNEVGTWHKFSKFFE